MKHFRFNAIRIVLCGVLALSGIFSYDAIASQEILSENSSGNVDDAVVETVYASEDDEIDSEEINLEGYTPPEYEQEGISVYASLPSSYSSKTSSIRNRGSWGVCWSFATMAQAEAYMINKEGASTDIDLSERALAYFYYNNVDDPLGNLSGDSTTLSSGYKFYNAGGNPYGVYLLMSGYCGATTESLVPYNTSDTSATAKKYAFENNYVTLKNAYYMGDSVSVSTLKQAVIDYGGISCMYCYDSSYYNSSTGSFYCNKASTVNHAACIVGWDDNYSRNNFKTKPSSDGAWKVKNSWGTTLGDSGYDWISYEDKSLSGFIVAEYSSGYDSYDYNYHYDGTGGVASVSGSSGIKFANIFEVKGHPDGDEQLEAVSFALNSTNVNYSIQVYTNITDTSNPESGKAALSSPVTGKTTYAGVYQVDLSKPVDLGESSYYSIVITFTRSSGSIAMFADCDHTSGIIAYKTGAQKGQSFHKTSSGTWTDAASSNRCYRIKGLVNNIDEFDKDINDATIKLSKSSYAYTGSAIKPSVEVDYGSKILKEGTDYSLSYSNNTNVGTATVTVTGLGHFKGTSAKKNFTITGSSLAGCTMTLSSSSYTYDGSAKKPSVTIKNGSSTVSSSNYTVSYSNNTNAGTATVTAQGKGSYSGSLSKTFKISAKSISGFTATLSPSSYTYDGTSHKPSVTLKNGSTTIGSSNYTVSYSNNRNVGTGTATITGKGNYTGTLKKTFTIKSSGSSSSSSSSTSKKIGNTTITLSNSSYTYTGSAIKPSVTVKDGSTTLKNGTHYTLSYSSNKNVGTGKVTITGKGSYSGSTTKTFTIKARNMSSLSYSKISDKAYTGSAIKPSVTVKNGSTALKKGTDFTLSYSNNKSTGKATVTVKGTGDYTGSKKIYFYIVPKKVTISSVSSSKKALTVKYKKATGASGYQIAYRQKGSSKWTTTTAASTSKKISKLKSNKTYQVKVRAYKTVSGTKHYGSYSSVKEIKTS